MTLAYKQLINLLSFLSKQNRTERNLYILYQDGHLISLSFKMFTSSLLALLLCIQTIEIKEKS